jgi:hypothetical protein
MFVLYLLAAIIPDNLHFYRRNCNTYISFEFLTDEWYKLQVPGQQKPLPFPGSSQLNRAL